MRSLFLFLLPPQVSHELRKYVPDLGHSSFDCHYLRLSTISGRQLVGARRKNGMRSVFFALGHTRARSDSRFAIRAAPVWQNER